jgi:signal transduction histidine kinase
MKKKTQQQNSEQKISELQKELENKNRELEIEASLERVRAVAMGMHKSEDLLNVSEVLYKELYKLGFIEIRNAMINIHNDENKTFFNYDYSDEIGRSKTLLNFNTHPVMEKQIKQSRIANDAFSEAVYKGKNLEQWKEFRRKYGEKEDPRIEKIKALYYYFYSIGTGTIGISTFSQIDKEKLVLLKRFRNVFSLAYRRYTDIALAEGQAREAQIEASLERVRAVAMSMQKSDDLLSICEVSFKEFKKLGFDNLRNAIIHILNDEQKYFMDYDYSDYLGGGINKISYDSHPMLNEYLKKIKKANDAFAEVVIDGDQLESWKDFRRRGGQQDDPRLDDIPALYYYLYSIGVGDIGISTFKQIDESQIKILKRFRNVFDLAYRRYKDIAQAEAQAREAQIELALERVRARTMAMQKSEELKEVIQLVYDQFIHLNIHIEHTGFILDYKARDDMHIWLADRHEVPSEVTIPYFDSPPNNSIKEAKEKGEDFFKYLLTFEEKNKFYQELFKFIPGVPEETLKYYFHCPGLAGSGVLLENVGLYIENFSGIPYSDDENRMLIRFGKVFQQTYTRFLDLQKAEAQAREAQIETALERVRSKAMSMQKSDDLSVAVQTIFNELDELDIGMLRCGIGILNKEKRCAELWTTTISEGKNTIQVSGDEPMDIHPLLQGAFNAWLQQTDFSYVLEGEDLTSYYKSLLGVNFKLPESQSKILKTEGLKQYYFVTSFKAGGLFAFRETEFPNESKIVMRRFADVFNLTYTRFQDLQQAEAQAHEAQIEVALERVRSRSMGMQKSNELKDVVRLLYNEFRILVTDIHSVNIQLNLDSSKDIHFWASVEEDIYPELYHLPYSDLPIFEKFYNAFNSPGDGFFDYLLNKEEKDAFFSEVFKVQPVPPQRKKMIQNADGMVMMGWFHKHSGIDILRYNLKRFSDEEKDIVKRFAAVFEQTYIRFLDLQKAEAQAREAQIEASLERVRARTAAMHKSEELVETSDVLFKEIEKLGIEAIRAGVALIDGKKNTVEVWSRSEMRNRSENRILGIVPASAHPMYAEILKTWKEKKPYCIYNLEGDNLVSYYKKLSSYLSYPKREKFNKRETIATYFFAEGSLNVISREPLNIDQNNIMIRFAKVFGQLYKRFLDLQKAEAQARESEIQLALERVRARTMAMHKSDELAETAAILFQQMTELGVTPERLNICLIKETEKILEVWATDQQGIKISHHFNASLDEPTTGKRVYDAWKEKKKSIIIDLSGKELNDWIRYVREVMGMTIKAELVREHRVHSVAFFSQGMILTTTPEPLPKESIKLLERFADVFNLTYRRFLDLQKAEAQAREAIKQASLDRVRGEIASMRTADDLNRITPIIWKELKTLEVPFIRCGVFIVDEIRESVQVYLTTPDGKPLGVLNLPFNSNNLTLNTVEFWKKKEVYREHWNREEFISWTKSMMELGQVQKAETYQGSAIPPESLNLHFIPFTQGMLYVGDVSPLTEEKLELVKALAEAFAIAYARYEDFKNLEEAKNKIELTLKELKSAQAQLVHSEKMASLGELTAGIAHEIKNPLNFVNNFSEVSRELLDEMKVEIQNNNLEEVIEIVEDLKQNLEKINTHGKRADSIVKGMLLHSRGTSGEKTLTDINDLLDQYVNLAYHGMRATNKEFNITIEIDYDKTLEKINVVPQDISRVFLNIINNACYAAYDRKKKGSDNNFSPILKVSTKNLKDKVEIRISDNGNGIPKDIIDKIFQPFFTTKPTGEGTGLGLSLSYDIVTKQHGGEIKIESKEGEGAEFVISFPK